MNSSQAVISTAVNRQFRLAVITPHVIQYQAPLYRALAARPEIDLHVFFCSRWGVQNYNDPGFGKTFSWDLPLLEGYQHRFLRNCGWRSGPSTLFSLVNPGALGVAMNSKYDAVVVNGWSLFTNWLVWLGCTLTGKPLLVRGESNGSREPTGLRGIIKKLVVKVFLVGTGGFLTIGSRNAAFYRSYGVSAERMFLTPYAVDNSFFFDQAKLYANRKEALRRDLGLPVDMPIILFSGKFQQKKRPLDLLQAFKIVRQQVPAALVFVGDGALRHEMERFIKDNELKDVYPMGFRNQKEIPAFYAMADIFVLPSDYEPWGLVVNEAMCFGLPIIVSDRVGAAYDLVRHGENGYVFPVGDISVLAMQLLTTLNDVKARQRMGYLSKQIISHWGIDQDVQGVVEALAAVCSRE